MAVAEYLMHSGIRQPFSIKEEFMLSTGPMAAVSQLSLKSLPRDRVSSGAKYIVSSYDLKTAENMNHE